MVKSLKIRQLRFLPGASADLAEPTALCELHIDGGPADWPAAERRLRRRASAFRAEEGLLGESASDWPGACLTDRSLAGPGAWVVALTVAVQRLARDPVRRGSVVAQHGDAIELALPYCREPVLRQSLRWALRYLVAWLLPDPRAGREIETLDAEFDQWLTGAQRGGLAPNTLRFALAAAERDVPVQPIGTSIRLGWGAAIRWMDSSFTDRTSVIGSRIARDKHLASQVLAGGGVPVPESAIVTDLAGAKEAAARFGWPVVVKPGNRDQGQGVVPGIGDLPLLERAYEAARRLSPAGVIVERHVEGDDHRMLVVGGRLLAAARRDPGGVTGDGRRSVRQLLEELNADPRRGTGKRSLLMRVELDEEAQELLRAQGLDVDSIPAAGRFVRLRRTANVSTGGLPVDVTGQVHPDNRDLAERAAKLVGLDIAGVDFLCPDIGRSWREVGGAICEVNAQPGFRPHWLGDPERDINGEIVDWMRAGSNLRIPVAAITGTNGKTTTASMLHRILIAAGLNAGVCTTAGVWIGDRLVSERNLSGHPGGRVLLADPDVQAAVIEMPRKGLLVFGHPCDRYDVAALLNVQDDHLGVDGIDTREQMASLKAQVLRRASGAIVVNAQDPLCVSASLESKATRTILVTEDPRHSLVLEHRAAGGEAVLAQEHQGERWVVIARGEALQPVVPLSAVPAYGGGLLPFNATNALFAAALAHAMGVDVRTIADGLKVFGLTPESNPGRYSFVEGLPFRVVIDFAHNPDGLRELCRVVGQLPVAGRRWLVNAKVGIRHRSHVTQCAPMIAEHFDRVVVGPDPVMVARCRDWAGPDPVGAMCEAFRSSLREAGLDDGAIRLERDPARAIDAGLAGARDGDLLVILADPWLAMRAVDKRR